jgi:hypothetical protein
MVYPGTDLVQAGRRRLEAGMSESVLCRIGHAYEQVTPWHLKHPAV